MDRIFFMFYINKNNKGYIFSGNIKINITKGRPQLKKSLKFQLQLDKIFQTPPLFEKGLTDKNVGISYLIVIIKFFFSKFHTSPISSESRTSPILSIGGP